MATSSVALAGPYNDVPVANTDARIVAWATSVSSITRGPQDIANPSGPLATFGSPSSALGPAEGTSVDVVSLGDGGSITLRFANPIANGSGTDFAVFENGFAVGDFTFAELGYVDVSSDGVHFYRFASVSLTPTDEQVGPFDTIDPTDVHNLAGQFPAGEGTPFDLSDIGPQPFLDLYDVTYVRITDVVGRIAPTGSYTPSLDSLGNVINDPYSTPFASGGFDLDGVAVLHASFVVVPEPSAALLAAAAVPLVLQRRLRR